MSDETENKEDEVSMDDWAAAMGEQAESEADVIIDDSKKNFRVSQKELDECIGQWDPQTQMTKEEWASSCRDTLQYFPEGN